MDKKLRKGNKQLGFCLGPEAVNPCGPWSICYILCLDASTTVFIVVTKVMRIKIRAAIVIVLRKSTTTSTIITITC